MPPSSSSHSYLLREPLGISTRTIRGFWPPTAKQDRMIKGFRDFILRGNVVDLAVAVVIGAAFTTVVTAFTKNVIEPLINAVTPPASPGFGIQLVAGKPNTYIDLASVITAVVNFLIV